MNENFMKQAKNLGSQKKQNLLVDGKLKTCEEKIDKNRENINNNRVRIDTSAQKIAEISIGLATKESI